MRVRLYPGSPKVANRCVVSFFSCPGILNAPLWNEPTCTGSCAIAEHTYAVVHFGKFQRDQVSDKSEKTDIFVTICRCLMWAKEAPLQTVAFFVGNMEVAT